MFYFILPHPVLSLLTPEKQVLNSFLILNVFWLPTNKQKI